MLSDKEIDAIVYEARQRGADDTYSVVRAACSKVLVKQAAQAAQPNEADELLRNLGLDPDTYRMNSAAPVGVRWTAGFGGMGI